MRAHPLTDGTRPDEDYFLAGPTPETARRVDRDRRCALLADIRRQPRRTRLVAAVSACP